MPFTIVKTLEQQLPSYSLLYELAEQNGVRLTGDEHRGTFACRGVEGDYEFGEGGLRGKFAGYKVSGEFSLATGQATVTVIEKPFWLPEMLLKQKIQQGLDRFLSRSP